MKVNFHITHTAPEGATHYSVEKPYGAVHLTWYRIARSSTLLGCCQWYKWMGPVIKWYCIPHYTNKNPDHIKQIQPINHIESLII